MCYFFNLLKGAILFFIYTIVISKNVLAVENVHVQALFPGKAVIQVDGERRILAVGEVSPEGVRLLKADSKTATLEINGVSSEHALGSSSSFSYKEQEYLEEQVFADKRGMFLAIGSINGQTVKFLVDTGATTIAMNTTQAKKLGVRYRIDGDPTRVSTASGFANGYSIKLKTVSLGKIKLNNVDAMVIDGKHPGPILLGMSFLNKLKVEKSGGLLKVRQVK